MARTPPPACSPQRIEEALRSLPEWAVQDGALARTCSFRDFACAFAFMTRVAFAAEQAKHHPDWRNVYRRVEIRLSTHESKAITERDLDLAAEIEAIFVEMVR